MVSRPEEQPSLASVPSQSSLETFQTSHKMSSTKATQGQPVTTATTSPAVASTGMIYKDLVIPPFRGHTTERAQEWPDILGVQKEARLPYHAKWQIPRMQHRFFDHSDIVPPKNVSFDEQLLAYIQRWALWISEVKDPGVRDNLIEWSMTKMEKVWHHGIDFGLFPRYLPNLTGTAGKKALHRRDKYDDTLLFDDMIETTPIKLYRNNTQNFRITNAEFEATRADFDAVNTRIAARDVAAGQKLFDDFVQELDSDTIAITNWKNREGMTSANPMGRDLFVYALHETQIAKAEIRKLRMFLIHHKTPNQKRNTNTRIADQAAREYHWLAIAIELDKVRPKDETTDVEGDDVEVVDLSFAEAVNTPVSVRYDTPSPVKKKALNSNYRSNDEIPIFPATEKATSVKPEEALIASGPKVKIAVVGGADQIGREQERQKTPLMPETPGRRFMVRLRPPKKPDDADAASKHTDHPVARNEKKKRKRRIVEESDSDSEDEETVRQQLLTRGRRSKRLRRKSHANYQMDDPDYKEAEDE